MMKAVASARVVVGSGNLSGKTEVLLLLRSCCGCCCACRGIIYSFWRRSKKIEKCPYCQKEGVLPVDSPQAQSIRAGRSG